LWPFTRPRDQRNGREALPPLFLAQPRTIRKLAEALGVDPAELVGD
jgi:hypothetical protein